MNPLRVSIALLASIVASSATQLFADEQPQPIAPLAGHSHLGEAFNEGPRQSAVLLGGTGDVNFPIATKNEQAQAFFNQGLGQLHGFWYFEAERSFRQTAKLDPDCAMAYWGLAMANVNNEERAKQFIADAVKRKSNASEREQLYVDALEAFYKADPAKKRERGEAYVKSLEKILYKYPGDVEAKALLALQIWSNRNEGIPISSHLAVNALLDQVFAANPNHPAHHYRIHLWDDENPQQALASAAALGPAVPSIAHMWHMPGHTYSKLKRYADAAWQQEASARVDHAHMMRTGILPDQIHNFAHNNEWLIRNLTHLGRARDAIDLAKNMIELPQHPRYNSWSQHGSSLYGRQRLIDVLTSFELWDELVTLCHSEYLPESTNEDEQIRRLKALARAYVGRRDLEQATAQQLLLQSRLSKAHAAMESAGAEAENKAKSESKDEKQIAQLRDDARKPHAGKVQQLEESIAYVSGHVTFARGDAAAAVPLLEKGKADPSDIALAQFAAGQRDAADKTSREHVERSPSEVLPLVYRVSMLWSLDRKDEAASAFNELREVGSAADLDTPVLIRLAPVATALNLPPDWRLPAKVPSDLGARPALDTLGPFRWSPSAAPAWSLTNVSGQTLDLNQYRGKATILIFYLGHDCLHCAQQLQAFAPMVNEFADARLSLIGISTDDTTGLAKSIAAYKDGQFPFPLLANPELDVFKKYRAYDDFESQPLHGVFLIDADGLIRWSDISFEPFMDAKFLLSEAKRLLGQSKHYNLQPPQSPNAETTVNSAALQ